MIYRINWKPLARRSGDDRGFVTAAVPRLEPTDAEATLVVLQCISDIVPVNHLALRLGLPPTLWVMGSLASFCGGC
jgi:hypothetical protein